MAPKDEEFGQIKADLIKAVEANIAETKAMRADMNRLFETTQFHDQALYGDKVDKPGAMEDIRNLKKQEAGRQKVLGFMGLSLIGIVLERVYHLFLGK